MAHASTNVESVVGMEREQRRSVGELAGNRTQDPRIKSALLYQLSYELTVPLCCYLTVTHAPAWMTCPSKQQGHPHWVPLLCMLRFGLRQVVADRGLEDVVGTLRTAAGVR